MKLFFRLLFLVLFCFLNNVGLCYANNLPSGFVYLHDIDSSIYQELGFATKNNFVGESLHGYNSKQVICTINLAKALKKVQKALKKINPNYSLRVLDAYRPVAAVEHIKNWAKDLEDQKTKEQYYPNIEKKDLLGKYMAAGKSSHSRGSTVDITIIDTSTKKELDFGPIFFGDYVHVNYSGLSYTQKKNRYMLRKLMLKFNFKPYDAEFWHFTLKNEPFPKTYFNFTIYDKR